MQSLINNYRENPSGIRNDSRFINICIRCGSNDVKSKNDQQTYFKICNRCGNNWYHNHCWSCSSHRQVDSRDSENYICTSCGWVKCTCGACRHGCGRTGHYDNNHIIEPTEVEREKIEAEKAALRIIEDKKRQKIAEYVKIKKDSQEQYYSYVSENGFFSGIKKLFIPDQLDKIKEDKRDNIVKMCDVNINYLNNQKYGVFDTTGLQSAEMVSFSAVALGVDLSFRAIDNLVKDKVVVSDADANAMFEDVSAEEVDALLEDTTFSVVVK